MKPTPAPRDDIRPGPLGLWALGLAGATRSRWSEEVVRTDEDEVLVRGGRARPGDRCSENDPWAEGPAHPPKIQKQPTLI
jgi:hypothetical protein